VDKLAVFWSNNSLENEIRYLGIYEIRSRKFKCLLDYSQAVLLSCRMPSLARSEDIHLKKLFCNSFRASVIVRDRSMCPLTRTLLTHWILLLIGFLTKLFKINDIDIVKNCPKKICVSVAKR